MKGFEMTFPAIDVSYIEYEKIVAFAKNHGVTEEQLTPYDLETDTGKARLFWEVSTEETGMRFVLGNTSEGYYMIWNPNMFQNEVTFSELFDIMRPYMREIGEYSFDMFHGEVTEFECD